jgi:hypothetical protein|tara:strand:- start:316 stop:780 length:465 start_codon:yes stop_codon:yes gene_type:complete
MKPIQKLKVNIDDGGRAAAGYKGETNDCACRAIAIATGMPYQKVYDELTARTKSWRINSNSKFAYYAKPSTDTARTSMPKIVAKEYLKELGWTWIPTMFIGLGCKVHLRKDELPAGRLLVHVSKHITAVIDGVLHDAYDCSREGTRCVYGYWKK